jgi:transketolase
VSLDTGAAPLVTDRGQLTHIALRVREHVLNAGASPVGAHVGGALSAADVLTALYFGIMLLRPDQPDWPGRDRFVLSKGHVSSALYGCLAERGFLPVEELATYGRPGSRLAGHPLPHLPGVEFGTGALGHGLALGVGLALAARRDGRPNRTFVLLGDGELQEGSVWEAAMAASHLGLERLSAIVDRNGFQISGRTEERLALEPVADRWASFGWETVCVDGHDLGGLLDALRPVGSGRPRVVVARTVKGKGVPFIEDRKRSHYVTLSPDLHQRARRQLLARRVAVP